jgi:hypothetical protein
MVAKQLSTKQAAFRAGVSRFTLQRAHAAGELFGIKNNRGHWLWDVEALDIWSQNRPERENPKQVQPIDENRLQDLALSLGRAEGKVEMLQTALEKAEAEALRERKRADNLQGRTFWQRLLNS